MIERTYPLSVLVILLALPTASAGITGGVVPTPCELVPEDVCGRITDLGGSIDIRCQGTYAEAENAAFGVVANALTGLNGDGTPPLARVQIGGAWEFALEMFWRYGTDNAGGQYYWTWEISCYLRSTSLYATGTGGVNRIVVFEGEGDLAGGSAEGPLPVPGLVEGANCYYVAGSCTAYGSQAASDLISTQEGQGWALPIEAEACTRPSFQAVNRPLGYEHVPYLELLSHGRSFPEVCDTDSDISWTYTEVL